MKTQNILIAMFVAAGIGGSVQLSGWGSSAQADPAVQSATSVMTMIAGASNAEYVGSKKCKACHQQQYKSWEQSKKSSALDTLMSGKSAELKSKHNLDPNKDYTKDKTCLACHTTGFGKDGGYFLADASDAKAVKNAEKLAGVGCESCHGPGGEYIKFHKDLLKSKAMYTADEMFAAGLQKIQASVCTQCHNSDNPTYDAANPFDFDKYKDKGAHDHFPLKQRKG